MSDAVGAEKRVEIFRPMLQKNQKKLTIQVCLQRNFLFVTTIKISFSLPSLFTICSNTNAITNPIANMKKQKLKN